MAALGADIYLFSLYKTYGPHQGLMVARPALPERLPNQAHFFNADRLLKKLTPPGPHQSQIAASACLADYFTALRAPHFTAARGPAPRGHRAPPRTRAEEPRGARE